MIDGAGREEIWLRLVGVAGREFAREALAPKLGGPRAGEIALELRRDYEDMVARRMEREGDAAGRIEAQVRRLEAEVGLASGTVEARVGEEAERRTRAAGTRGLTEGRTIWVQ